MPFVTIRVAGGDVGAGEEARQKKVEIERRSIAAICDGSGIAPELS